MRTPFNINPNHFGPSFGYCSISAIIVRIQYIIGYHDVSMMRRDGRFQEKRSVFLRKNGTKPQTIERIMSLSQV